ncbi:MAG: asparagine synthase (glutamine-hydrolyzing), partial [Actinomycetota bacterium]|nr:asparagine synthase (glutamine-hydrolyzing) [Actinomycetota bacterium]
MKVTMCGINGILRLSDDAPRIDRAELLRTRDAMAPRGPDGFGEWFSPSGRIALGHRRLSIIDLSPAGAQPMAWRDGRYRIVFNGEIYNYRELRAELAGRGVEFRSRSDTEVIAALYAREGVAALARLRGMFALAIWDESEGRLLLARDPYGIKPLYYAVAGGTLRFASQVKALEAGGVVSQEPDPAGVAGFLLWGSVPEPLTLRRAVRAVPAGHFLIVEGGRVGEPRPHHRWVDNGAVPPAADIREALTGSVRAHLVADVPVAVFLSAGLDSALLAALAARLLPEPPVTFTLRFASFLGSELDEAPVAAEVARALGTRHTERLVGREEFLDIWPRAIAAMDQPSIDGFNTFLISRAAHEAGLKVVLSGLGGDELFGSYPSFADVPRWAGRVRLLRLIPGLAAAWPGFARRARPRQPRLAGMLRYGGSLPGAYFLRKGLFLPEELPGLLGREVAEEGLAAYDPIADAGKLVDVAGRRSRPRSPAAWRAVHVMESTQYMRNQLLR